MDISKAVKDFLLAAFWPQRATEKKKRATEKENFFTLWPSLNSVALCGLYFKLRVLLVSLGLIFLFSHSGFTQAGTKLTLKQAIETAISNNLESKQRNLQMQTAAVNWRQAKANMLPDLFANINHGTSQGRNIDPASNSYVNQNITFANYNLGSSVTLFNGFFIQNNIKQNGYAYEASKMEWQQAKDNITLNVILAYLQILSNEDLLQQSLDRAVLTRLQVERLDVLNKEGAIAPALYYDLKGQLAGDELAAVDNQNALDASKLNLSQLMNIPFDKTLEVERINMNQLSILYDATVEQIYEIAQQQLAIIKASQLRKESARKGVQTARGNFYPAVFLSGNIGTNYSSGANSQIFQNTFNDTTTSYITVGTTDYPLIVKQDNYTFPRISFNNQVRNNYGTSLNLGIRIPILNSLQARNNVALAKINLKNAEYIEDAAKIQLKQSIEEAYFNMTAAFKRFQLLEDQVRSFAESFRAAEVRFNAGAGTSVDYLVAKNNLERSNINLISARYDYILRTRILDYYQGKLLW